MYYVLFYALIIVSFLIILFVLMQPSKQQDALSLLASDRSNDLFETQKPKGMGYLLQYATGVLGVIWITLGILLTYLGKF